MTKQEAQQLWQYQVQLRRIATNREAGVEDRIRKEFQRVLQKIQQILSQYYIAFGSNENSTMSAGDLRAVGQYQNFLQDVLSGLDGISEPIDQEIRAAIESAYTVTYNGMVRGVQQASEGTLALRDALGGLIATTPETVQRIVEHPMDKLKLSTILKRRRSQIVSHTKKTLAVGLADGSSYTQMAHRIAESLNGDYNKAMRIVRTESNRAINRGFEDVAQRTSDLIEGSDYIQVKQWCSMEDESVRDTHRHLNGKVIHVKDKFVSKSGRKADCPGDFGDPSEDINCRCFLAYRFLTREEFLAQGGKLPENSGLTDGENGGIINEKRKKAITQITDKIIDSVPNVNIQGYTDMQCKIIQEQHKELLKYSRANNGNKEVAFVFESELANRRKFSGSDDTLNFGTSLYGRDLFVMHNHPRNSSFSDTDIAFILSNDNVKSLSIVKNNGEVEVLTKLKSYDKEVLMIDFKRQYKKFVKTGTDNEIEKAIKTFITRNKEMISWDKNQ